MLGLLAVLGLSTGLTGGVATPGVFAAAGFYGLAICFALAMLRKSYPHRYIGLCNVVTIVRLVITSGLVAALFDPAAGPWPIFALAVMALSLDGIDGWLARRGGYESAFGAMFDMEVDSAFALLLAFHAFLGGSVGVYVIILGLPHYIFLIAQLPMPWLVRDLPPRFSRKVVCVLQISSLILVLLPFVQTPLSDAVVLIAAGTLIWSFWLDVRWLWQARE